ncbi:MAG: DUF4421 family protein [Prevotella sp.]|nr:DUF4421 family protein [Prevotella sp.]
MKKKVAIFLVVLCGLALPVSAQNFFQRVDSTLTANYRKGNIDTNYISRPTTKWTLKARYNLSGAKIEAEGVENDRHFRSELTADYKSTLSMAVSYLGVSVSAALNPAKLMGKYNDYELNINAYGNRFGWDFIYQNAKNYTGWHDHEGVGRIELPADMLSVKTLNLNAYYAFNSRRFSYPAAFSQSYFQRRSAGSFLLAASAMTQHAELDWLLKTELKMTNIGIGAGYGYNYVPAKGWLLHLSSLPTFMVSSHTSMTFGGYRIPLDYHFPEVIITGRGAVVKQTNNLFYGLSMVYNFSNIGNEKELALHNQKWRIRLFVGLRL